MNLSATASLTLGPEPPDAPLGSLLAECLRLQFRPDSCAAAIERVCAAAPDLLELLDPAAPLSGGTVATRRLLFPASGTWILEIEESGSVFRFDVPDEQVRQVADFLRRGSQAWECTWREEARALLGDEAGRAISAAGSTPRLEWPRIDGPGLYRREHASLLVRSRTTGVLVDPIGLVRALPGLSGAPVSGQLGVDAIAVTHHHGDHWSLPSVIAAGCSVPVLVPRVERPTLLTPEDFAASLRRVGTPAVDAPWGETVAVGDMEIDVLPFYGEQPTRDAPGAPVRSVGNCYRFNTEDFSAILLVDSGVDPEGSVAEVVADSVRRRGPPDVVLSCLREFASPFFGGLDTYWATLPFARLQDLFRAYVARSLPSTTAGPALVAEVCARAGTRFFLPYANGFAGVGRPISDVGWGAGEPSERALLAAVDSELATLGATTRAVPWNPGDVVRFCKGSFSLGGAS